MVLSFKCHSFLVSFGDRLRSEQVQGELYLLTETISEVHYQLLFCITKFHKINHLEFFCCIFIYGLVYL